ncbi:MAG TPA: energy transducer TonB [Pyrinomonadaceae bacterium]|jgi:outer membrane biosynthesis protein TonB|nr:energy transducer TonB [Pyrinomonadaceae bacterium]
MSLTTLRVSLLALLCLTNLNANARAHSPGTTRVRAAAAQDSAAKSSQGSKESRASGEGDVVKAEELCASAESLSKQGDTRGALEASGESVKLYKRIYLGARRPTSTAAPDARARFRTEMAARLRRAPACVELYSRLGGPEGASDFKRGQLDALRAHAVGITESDASGIIYFWQETDERAVLTYRPPTRFPREARRDDLVETVRLRVVLAADGEVKHPLVMSGSESPFLEPSIEAAKGTKFKPAVKDGRAVSQFVTLEFNFSTH